MFLLVPAYPGCPGQTVVKWLLLLSILFRSRCASTFVCIYGAVLDYFVNHDTDCFAVIILSFAIPSILSLTLITATSCFTYKLALTSHCQSHSRCKFHNMTAVTDCHCRTSK